MKPTQHTPEPWHVFSPEIAHPGIDSASNESIVIWGDRGESCGIQGATPEEAAANATRIVACVNGCAGISDPETTVPELVAALKHARKKLIIAIELAGLEDDEKVSDYPVIKQIDDALSKVTHTEGGVE